MPDPTQNSSRKMTKVLKIAALALLSIFVLYHAAHLGWTYSGSNEWQLTSDEDGIKLWSLKTPGVALLKVKGEMRIAARLSTLMAMLEDEDAEASADMSKVAVLERKDTPQLTLVYHDYVQFFPPPLGRREFILQTHHSQDPVTRKIEVSVLAAPNRLPPRADIVRIEHLHNIWVLNPLPNGEVELQLFADVDLGGNVPDIVQNMIMPQIVKLMFTSLRNKSTWERFVHAHVLYIKEPGET
jgi:hypothetical protein